MLGVPFFVFGGGISISTFSFLGSGFTPCLDMISPKNGTDVHQKWHLSLLIFRFTCLHICSTLHSVSSWFLPSALYPAAKMSSAVPYTLGKSLNISFIFLWNISLVGAAPNSSLLYLYVQNWHANVVRYANISYSFRL